MAYENDICDLGGQIGDATDHVQHALRLAERLMGATQDDDPGWPAMEVLAGQLDAINKLLAELPSPEITEAIEQANVYMDEMSDRADGNSY